MHPHIQFFDQLASRMSKVDMKVSRLLCGIRDQVDAAHKANSAGRVKLGCTKSVDSVLRSVNQLIAAHGEQYPDMRRILARFVEKVERTGSLI